MHIRTTASSIAVVLVTACLDGSRSVGPDDDLVIAAASPTQITSVAGLPVSQAPTVIIQDRKGAPRAGIIVGFTLTGPGRISGSIDTTDASGIARVREWLPGSQAGSKSVLTAYAAPAGTVEFAVRVVAAPASKILKLAGDNQIADVQREVAIKPVVQVTDAFGNGVPGTEVRFDVSKGGGTVTPREAVTDSLGKVTLSSWTLGSSGDQVLLATIADGNVVQAFHATAIVNLGACSAAVALVPGATLASRLSEQSCSQGEALFAVYYLNVPAASAWALDMRSADFDSFLELRDADSKIVAYDNDDGGSGKDATIRALLAPGVYQVIASSPSGKPGNFSLSLFAANPGTVGCGGMFAMRGTTNNSQLIPKTCNGVKDVLTDEYRLHLSAGATLVLRVADRTYSGFDIDLLDGGGRSIAKAPQTENYLTYGLSYTPDTDIDLVVRVSSADSWAEYVIEFK